MPRKQDPIIIVGAGIFGLSTALHLARRGYTNVSVFDKQPYDERQYSYLNGCDAASADMNKIIRSAYGGSTEYQSLTLSAITEWETWNAELAAGKDLPPGLTSVDRVFIKNGHLVLTDKPDLPDFELATITNMEKAGYKDTQLSTLDPHHIQLAQETGLGYAIDPFHRRQRGQSNVGVLDTTGGLAVADKACRFALHKARTLGVKFIFGPAAGKLDSLVYAPSSKSKVTGIKTADGKTHAAEMTILACGGWTPSILPALDNLCEATAGSVVLFKLEPGTALFERFAPDRFPSWQYKMRDGAEGGLYGFPRDENGWLKIGYRGTKYTNPVVQGDGKERSVPVTRWSDTDQEGKFTSIPEQAVKVVRSFLASHLPELAENGVDIALTRVCWYTDSFDNHLVVDRVPECEGLMVATGGSGHAFKYLPVIGEWVVDVLEGVGGEREAVRAWRWRELKGETPANVLMEGRGGSRAFGNVPLLTDADMRGKARL
ncbi:FAD dependent oxidoreductase [Aspergillus karnatakaensis]|uniref:NAD(P)/FAD-dependent oxidoreductase n=1 Tax=Aspergillus karnatakaensis TaxID=1810916 RepID=UPI003CCD3FCE